MKVYLAAIETAKEHSVAAAIAKAPSVLTSFFYARKPASQALWERTLRIAKLRLADSGAFTIRTTAMEKGNKKGTEDSAGGGVDYDAYLAEYVAWLQKLRAARLMDYWVEIDISVVTGYPWVERQREAYMRAGLGGGLVNVWHTDQDWAYWLYLLDEARRPGRSRYVAIEGHLRDRGPLDYVKFLREAYTRGVRVHGFKMTSADDMHRYPFYSVDSSSWLAPVTYGMNFARQPNGTLRGVGRSVYAESQCRGDLAVRFTKPKSLDVELRLTTLVASAKAWVKMGAEIDAAWRARGVDWEAELAKHEAGR